VSSDGSAGLVGAVFPDALDIHTLDRVEGAFVAFGRSRSDLLAMWTSVDGRAWEQVANPFPPNLTVGSTFSAAGRMMVELDERSGSSVEL
jgi:hypothetical protein